MTKFEKFSTSFLTVILLFLAGFFLWLYFTKWQQPLGPALQIPTPFGLPPTWTPNSVALGTPLTTPDPAFAINASPTLELVAQSPGVCGGTTPMYILVVGSDSRGDAYLYGLADVIRLVRVDFATPKVTVLEFPRDLWVEIPDIADNLNGQDHEKLNQAYLYGNRGFGYTDDPAEGPGLLARTLTLNFGTQIDQYAAVNMRTFVKIVDAVGGIDVTLPKTVDGRTAEDMNERLLFLKGTNHLNGTQAVTLARIRISGTFSRADNQDRVLCALRAKLASPEVIPNIPNLIRSFKGAVQTSLSPEQLGQLACVGTQLQPQNIVFGSFPQQLFEQDRTYDPVFKKRVFTWKVDYDTLREYTQRFNEGKWPFATVAHESPQEGDSIICQ
jgi:LCP family protein required for cell wall assembly